MYSHYPLLNYLDGDFQTSVMCLHWRYLRTFRSWTFFCFLYCSWKVKELVTWLFPLSGRNNVVTCPVDRGEGPQAWPGWGFILNTAGSSSWAYNLSSITHSVPPVTINSFITSSCPLTLFNAFTGIILRTEKLDMYFCLIHSDPPLVASFLQYRGIIPNSNRIMYLI